MTQRLYCDQCAENTIAHTTLVNNPPRTAPCDACYERLTAVFQNAPRQVLYRMLRLRLAVRIKDRGIDLTELGEWVWNDVWWDKRTSENTRRTMLGVLVKWGTPELISDMENLVTQHAWLRADQYGLDVKKEMEYAGELTPIYGTEKETA